MTTGGRKNYKLASVVKLTGRYESDVSKSVPASIYGQAIRCSAFKAMFRVHEAVEQS